MQRMFGFAMALALAALPKDWGGGFIDTKAWIATIHGSLESAKKNPAGSKHH